VGDIVDEAIALHPKLIWLQLGVVDDAAGQRAEAAGIAFIQDHCIAIEHGHLGV
jgi:predicted CoA-binding protein